MFVVIDFPDYFAEDKFSTRRSGTCFQSGNPYDPESLLSGFESARGCTYDNSRRNWPSESLYRRAVNGELTSEQILTWAPREILQRPAWILEALAGENLMNRLRDLID